MGNYEERLKTLSDYELRREWSEDAKDSMEHLRQIEHEMAMRFKKPYLESHYLKKLLDMPKQFLDAYYKKEWFRAKHIYDAAIIITMFLEIQDPLRYQLFGISEEDEDEIQGDFPRDIVSKVFEKCVVENKLGYDCMVYRIPGEIGFYGAKHEPGVTRRMLAEEKPIFWAQGRLPYDAERTG